MTFQQVVLQRTGPAEATVGMISLPLPKDPAGLRVDHPAAGTTPVGWWKRHEQPRRAVTCVVDDGGVPPELRLTDQPAPAHEAPSPWTVRTELTVERESYVAHAFTDIESLRGVPAHECATAQAELQLTFKGRTLRIQAGATGPKGGPYYWESVQVDPLWQNGVAEAIRVGGVIYNEDTYLWGDFYLVLFRNGVIDLAAHFVNTKLHIRGFDFQGLPMVRFGCDGAAPLNASLPADGLRFDLGGLKLNLSDSAATCSQEYPGRLDAAGADLHWYPVSRTFNPQLEKAPPTEWAVGFARTFRCQISLSDAPALIARYRAPAWWYAVCHEPWPWGYLPVRGQYDRMGEILTDFARQSMTRGRFDAGSARFINDGDAGFGMVQNYYHTGRPDILADALTYCYYWADLAVDHTDFTVHQWVGGWGWKTCAYTKFRDVLYAYLETGDPYLLDTVEMAAEAYWAWFRSNWPRCAIGRDAFELGGWALLWRFLRTEHARERTMELARMCRTVLESRGSIGGQIGAGPHPGYLASLYMTAVAMLSLLDAAEAASEDGESDLSAFLAPLRALNRQFMRDDREMFPSNYGETRRTWGIGNSLMWATMALRIYPEIARLQGAEDELSRSGLRRAMETPKAPLEQWALTGRYVMYYLNPLYADALLLGARLCGGSVEIAPIGEPEWLPARQTVETPFGDLTVIREVQDGTVSLRFDAGQDFPVRVRFGGRLMKTTSRSGRRIALKGLGVPGQTPAVDLSRFTGRGFPGDWDEKLARVPVAGIDLWQARNMVRLCPETESVLYSPGFSPTVARYRRGARPVLEGIVAEFGNRNLRGRVREAMEWVAEHVVHPHFGGPLVPDRALTEEQLIESGRGWCNEQTRVFIALCEVMGIPARLCFLFHANRICGHVTAEVCLDGRWAFVDVTFKVMVELPDGRLAEARELQGAYRPQAHEAFRAPLEDHARRVLPFVDDSPGWGKKDRPRPDRGGDLFDEIGICNYVIDGVEGL